MKASQQWNDDSPKSDLVHVVLGPHFYQPLADCDVIPSVSFSF